jgi:hypothetical protein
MPFEQFVILTVMTVLVTPLAVAYIPRTRRSRAFDALLWIATLLLGFLGGWFALGYVTQYQELGFLNDLMISNVPIMVVLIGCVGGAFFLNISLWVIDRLSRNGEIEEFDVDGPVSAEEDASKSAADFSESMDSDGGA